MSPWPNEATRRWFTRPTPQWVGGGEVLHVSFPDDVPLKDLAAERAYARQLFVHYLGVESASLPLAVWRYGRTRGASIWQASAGDAAVARAAAVPARRNEGPARLTWPAALRWAIVQQPEVAARPTCLVWVEGRSYLVLRLSADGIEALEPGWLSAPDGRSLAAALGELGATEPVRVVLGWGLQDNPKELAGFSLIGDCTLNAMPKGWLHGSDRWRLGGRGESGRLLQATDLTLDVAERAPAWLANAALACGALVLATTVHEAWGLHRQSALNAALAAPRVPLAVSAPADSLHQVTLQRDLNEAARLIHLPWAAALAGVEASAPSGVHWLEVLHSAEQPGIWQLRGRAPDVASALATAEALAGQGGWLRAQATRLEPPRPEDNAVVFTIEAHYAREPR